MGCHHPQWWLWAIVGVGGMLWWVLSAHCVSCSCSGSMLLSGLCCAVLLLSGCSHSAMLLLLGHCCPVLSCVPARWAGR